MMKPLEHPALMSLVARYGPDKFIAQYLAYCDCPKLGDK